MSDIEDVNNDSEEWVLVEGMRLTENVQVLNSETTYEEVGTEDNPFASQESCSGKEDDIDDLLSDNLSTNCPETELSDFSDLESCNQIFPEIEISPVKAYKHCRNEQLNFHLDLLLALAVATAVGLGTGHFLGWSTKCLEQGEKFSYLSSYKNHDLFESSLKQEPVKGTSKFISQQLQLFHDINHDIRKLDSYETNLDFEGGLVDDLPLNSINKKNMIIIFYRNFSFESGNESSEIYKDSKNIDLQPQNEFITVSKDLKNDTNKPMKKHNQPIIEELDVKIVKLIKKMHTSVLGGEYSSGNPSSQFKNDLSDTVQLIHDLVSNEIIKQMEIKPVSSKDDLKIVGEVYGNFLKCIDQKLTDFENFKNLPFDDIKLYRKKDKLLRKMTNSLVDSVDNLLRLSKKCFAKNQGFLKTEKLVKKSQNIIEGLEKKWEKNIKMADGKQAMGKSESKKQDSKQLRFKLQDGKSHFKEQDGEQPYFKKQDGEKSDFKKQNGKRSHFKKQDPKQSHFKDRDTVKVVRNLKTDQSQFKKQNPEQTHFKSKHTKHPYFKSKKQKK